LFVPFVYCAVIFWAEAYFPYLFRFIIPCVISSIFLLDCRSNEEMEQPTEWILFHGNKSRPSWTLRTSLFQGITIFITQIGVVFLCYLLYMTVSQYLDCQEPTIPPWTLFWFNIVKTTLQYYKLYKIKGRGLFSKNRTQDLKSHGIRAHTTRLIGLQVTCSDAAYLLLPSPRTNWVRPEQTANQSQIINSVGPAQKTWFKLVQPSNDQGVCTLIWFHLVADANTCYENAGCRSREVVKSRKKI